MEALVLSSAGVKVVEDWTLGEFSLEDFGSFVAAVGVSGSDDGAAFLLLPMALKAREM